MSIQSERDIDKLRKAAKKRIHGIFVNNGLSTYKRLGLQRELRDALIDAAVNGTIE